MPRVPLLSGTRLVVVEAGEEGGVTIAPPPPVEPIADVGAAVRDALRFPLAGEPLEALVSRGGRATVLVEPPALPVPGSPSDPRRVAIAATMTELDRAGAPFERQTLLVAGGLSRRPGHRELELLVPPEFARRFHGRVEVHDVEHPDLVELGHARVHPALVQTDLVVSVTAAETVVNGGPGALLAAAGPEAARAAGALSLLETAGSGGWKLAVELERELARRVPVTGVSLTLNTPALGGVLQGYPYDRQAVDRIANFPLRGLFGLLPGPLRRGVLRRLPNELSAFAVFAGPPSVAHAEALLLGVESRSAELAEPLDAICIGVPHTTPHLPREAPNPALAAYLGLGLALRLWRDGFPLVEGGTAILLSRFRRRFSHPTQQPYRALFQALRAVGAREPDELAQAEQEAAGDTRAVEAYRSGRSCHPLLPFAEWAACQPAIGRLGAVLVAGCRDAAVARQLGFVPTHGIGAALAMAHGRAGQAPRIGFLLSPPYFPVRVAEESATRRRGTSS
ncbi:MAG TPA: lactate racemase domain-containing protein [Gaiellaceae bacterium]|nr:lactate racemase domain-containing protein [Gaiellaceae bacterium]